MNTAKKVAYNTVVQIGGRFIASAISVAVIAILTRYLGVGGYGEYVTATAFVAFFAVFADFGVNLIVIREISKKERNTSEIIANVLGLRMVFSLAVLLFAPIIALFLSYSGLVKVSILVLTAGTYLISLNQIFVGVFQSRLKMDRAVFSDICGRTVILLFTLLFIHLKLGLLYIIGAVFLGNLFNLILSIIFARFIIKISLKFDFVFWKKLFLESLPMGLVLVLGMIYYKVDTIMLSLLKNSYDVGIYGASYKVFDFLVVLPGLFAGTVFPLLSRFYEPAFQDKFKKIFQKSFDVLAMAGFPAACGGIILAPYIINLIAGPDYKASVPVFQILSLTLLLVFLTQISGTVIVSIGKQSKLILPYLVCVIFNVGANIILISRYSYMGAAWVTFLTEILVLVFGYVILFREIRLLPNLLVFGKTILSTLAMTGFLWLFLRFGLIINWTNFDNYSGAVRIGSFAVLAVSSALFYGLILCLFKGYSKETVLSLIRREDK